MSGLLSQSLANLKSAEAQVTKLMGLPAAAVTVQTESAAVINKIIPQVTQLQTTVLDFVKKAIPQLKAVETAVSGTTPIDQLKKDLLVVHNEAGTMKPTIDNLATDITKQSVHINGYANTLATINTGLNTQIAETNGKIGTAKGKADAAHKRYYYLIALAPLALFGAPALIAAAGVALALYYSIKGDIDGYESTVSKLNLKVTRLKMMIAADKQLANDFVNLTSKIINVQNSIELLSGDIMNTIKDIDDNVDRLHIKLFVTAAMTEILTLKRDAS